MVAIALQAAVLRWNRIARLGAPDTGDADLREILKGALILRRGAVGKLPDAHPVVPAGPVVDHRAVPGRARRNDGDQYPTRHEQRASVGNDTILSAFAVLEEVGRVGKHQAHAALGDAHALEGAGDKLGLWKACAGNGGAFAPDFPTLDPAPPDLPPSQDHIPLPPPSLEHI